MDTKHTLAMLRQTLVQRKAIEDQVQQAIEPIKPTLRFLAELQAIYQEVYGAAKTFTFLCAAQNRWRRKY